ncbi:MAG: FMN-binding protein [Akkermansiaceae bacterium]|nr:FMN-binding protein [Akkermansiaceae bacterium]
MTALLLSGGSAFSAERVYQKPSDFIGGNLGEIPAAKAIALNATQQKTVRAILGKRYKTTSIRYWSVGKKTAFILEEIGKAEYITTGYVVSGGKISTVKVLVYRETHGWEVARPAFTKQLEGAQLKGGNQLSRPVKNIAGATLSVRALTKLARLALYLDSIK